MKILFLDLDGTILKGVSWKNQWRLNNVFLKNLETSSFEKIVIVTNQGGFKSDSERAKTFLDNLNILIKKLPFKVDYTAVAFKDLPKLRKPETSELVSILLKEFKITKISKDSLMIGDADGEVGSFSNSDLEFANNLGINFKSVNDYV